MSEQLKLGKIITGPAERDAIHIAVVPAIAGEFLERGKWVSLSGRQSVAMADKHTGIGIVDPFLDEESVLEGQKFWLYLIPGTITSLRHDWTHPALEPKEPSVEWLIKWADGYGSSYTEVLDRAKDYLEYGEYWNEGERFDGEWVPDEFWIHYQIVTGTIVPEDMRGSFFSCSC